MKSLLQFARDLAVGVRIFCVKPRCPYYSCEGRRFNFDEFKAHVTTHGHDDRPRYRRWDDVRDPAAKWARQTGDDA